MPAIDGLGSGLDTSTIIAQLMQIERLPQQRLSTQKVAALSRSTTWTQLNLAVGAIGTAAGKMVKAEDITGAMKATSSDTSVVGATAAAGAVSGTYKITEMKLATAQQKTFSPKTDGKYEGSLVLHDGLGTIGTGVTVQDKAGAGSASGKYTVKVEADGTSTTTYKVTVSTTNGSVTKVIPAAGTSQVGDLEFTATSLKVGTAEIAVARTKTGATLADLAGEVNNAGAVVSAALVNETSTSSKLVFSAKATGASVNVVLDDEQLAADKLGTVTTTTSGKDATFKVDGIAVTRSSNTIDDVLPGVTLTLSKEQATGESVTLTVAQDAAGLSAQAKALVDAVNGLLTQVKSATRYDVANKKTSPLTGDAGARQLGSALYTAIGEATPAGSGTTLSTLGITVQRDGSYAYDDAKFRAALASDPAGTAALLSTLSGKLADYAKAMNQPETVTKGITTAGITVVGSQSAKSEADRLQKQVDQWDARLALRQARYTRQFTQLDSVLGNLRSQGTWLSGALGGLGTIGSGQ